MNKKKKSRTSAVRNGSVSSRINHTCRDTSIIADQRLKNKLHNAILHGSVLGAILAVFGGICYIETNMMAGSVVSVLGLAWLWIFYLVNADDRIFR